MRHDDPLGAATLPLHLLQVLKLHKEAEAIKDADRRQEDAEKSGRERLQEKDDIRKRTRQERLHELRTGARKDWVAIARGYCT